MQEAPSGDRSRWADAAAGAPSRRWSIVGVIASALGIALGLLIDWFPPAASTQADKIDTLWDVLIIASVPVFVLVTTVVVFSVLEFRMRPGEENLDGPPIHGNTRLEVIWTAIPAIAHRRPGHLRLRRPARHREGAAPPRPKERVVKVIGEQFAWTFEYNEGGKKFRTAQLYLPDGRVGEVRRPVQGRPPRLLGAGLPHEDRRGARASRRATA